MGRIVIFEILSLDGVHQSPAAPDEDTRDGFTHGGWAAINAVHSDASTVEETDWRQIVALYDHLLSLTPSPVVALHRAVAVAEVGGQQVGLA